MDATPNARRDDRALKVVVAYVVFGALWVLLSDRLAGLLFTDPAQVIFIGTLKGWAFVAVTALLLFVLLNRSAAIPSSLPASRIPAAMRPRHLVMLFVLLAVVTGAAGGFVFDLMAGSIRDRVNHELAGVTELKVRQVDQWLRERRGNVHVYSNIPILKELLRGRTGEDGLPYRTVSMMLDLARTTYHFVRCEVIDPHGHIRVQSGEPRSEHMPAGAIAAAANSPGPVLIDFFELPDGRLRFGYAVAVRDDDRSLPLGFLLFTLDPARHFYPMLAWPVPTGSGEVLILRREGDRGLLLSPTRQGAQGRVLALQMELSQLEAQPLAGRPAGFALFAGRDYRGEPVLSTVQEMAGPGGWLLVAKIDEAEVYNGIRTLALTASGLIAAIVLGGGMLLAMVWRQQQLQATLSVAEEERARRSAEELALAAFEQAAVGMALLSLEGHWLRVNRRLCELVGYRPDELQSMRFQDITHPDDLAPDIVLGDRLMRGEADHYTREKRYVHKGGHPVWVRITVGLLRDEGGRPKCFVSAVEDMSERRDAEQARRASEANFELLVESAPDAVFIQTNGRFAYANAAAVRLFGARRAAELIGQSVVERFHPDFRATVAERIRLLNEERERVPVLEEKLLRLDGTPVDVEVNAVPFAFLDENGALVFARDITRRKRAQGDLRALTAELEMRVADRTAKLADANRELEAFAYSVSHDLRAPLRAIDGFSRILEEDHAPRLDPEGNRLLGVVRANAQRMDRLISDLLQLSRVSRGELKSVAVDMSGVVHAAYMEVARPDERGRIELNAGPLPAAQGDSGLLRQVWANLLSNAVKYSRPRPGPRIEVGGRVEDGRCVYWVRDNGVGFNPAYAHKLFGVFQRLHTAGEFEGTGVGLAIAQRIVQRHGGRMWAEGGVDAGAAFYFALPTSKETI